MLDGCFWGLLRKKSFVEIFNEIWPLARNQSSSEFKRILDGNKIFKKILDQNAQQYVASGDGFILDRLRLDILTIILNKIFN